MKKQFVLVLFFTSYMMSCGQPNRLQEKDYEWMPYKGDETLVFRSSKGGTDTIFLLKKDTVLAYQEAQSVNGIEYEIVSIFCKHTDPNFVGNDPRYLKNYFFRIEKNKDNRTVLKILLSANDANFYKLSSIRIDSLNKTSPSSLKIRDRRYNDVYIINA